MPTVQFVDQLPSNVRRQYALWLDLKTELSGALPKDACECDEVQAKMLKKAVIEHDFQVKLGINISQLK